jgi:hypothetical protein
MGSFMVRLWVLLWLGLSFLCKNFSDVIMSSYFFFLKWCTFFIQSFKRIVFVCRRSCLVSKFVDFKWNSVEVYGF